MVTAYAKNTSGETELHLYYGEKEISFDEPELFAFGEGLAKQTRFVAKTAATWGEGYNWPRIQDLLEQLLAEGILQRASTHASEPSPHQGPLPSPLPPAHSTVPRTWFECETIIRELTGRPLELGYLELIIPIYRVAHLTVDGEGRQVGEANVFPAPLRLDVPTEWRTCPYPGSRYQDDLPMNVTALKSMITYWQPMMAALLHIRSAYLNRFPYARQGWTVGDLQRLSTLVLTIPAYLLMREQNRVENGPLHPVLSSMYRITDGVRMTMHRMLFASSNAYPPDAPMTSSEIYAYAERNTVFLSHYGVCAGPRALIEEFLHVLVDGMPVGDAGSVVLDAPIHSVLRKRLCGNAATDSPEFEKLVTVLMDYLRQEQAIVRAASEIQEGINRLLGRTPPTRLLTASDLALHYRLVAFHYQQELQDVGSRLPYLVNELEEELGLRIDVSSDAIEISDRTVV